MEVGSKCPICGKRPKIDAIKFPAGVLELPCTCMFRKDVSVVIENWEYEVKRYQGKIKEKVSYNGFTGELVSLVKDYDLAKSGESPYVLSIYDGEKRVTHTFGGVKLEDIKFMGGVVAFGG